MSELHIHVLIDALGAEIGPTQGFLADLLPYRRALRTVLGFSSGAVPTILTGKPPASTGHWNLFYFDPKHSPFRWLRPLRFLPEGALNHRVSRKLLKETGRHLLGLGPLFECSVPPRQLPWFNYVEKKNLYAPGAIQGTASVFDLLQANHVPYRCYSYHEHGDAEILRRAKADLAARKARYFFLYLSEMDGFLHFHRQDDAAIAGKLAWYESELRELYALGKSQDADLQFTIFADHGMAAVAERFDLAAAVEALGLRIEEDYLAVYDSTMARFWFFNDRARQRVNELLTGQSCGRLLADDELEREGVFFADRRFGESIFLLHPGWLIAKSHFNGSGWNPSGMHGYHPDDPDSNAIFLSRRAPTHEMRGIADIFRCLAEPCLAGRTEAAA